MNAADHLAEVASAFQRIGVDVVFIGGATIPLYLDGLGAQAARATEDIDCIVDCVLASVYADVEAKLRGGGLAHCLDEDAPSCRWVYQTAAGVAVRVDVMPVSDILGFANRFNPGRSRVPSRSSRARCQVVPVATSGADAPTEVESRCRPRYGIADWCGGSGERHCVAHLATGNTWPACPASYRRNTRS